MRKVVSTRTGKGFTLIELAVVLVIISLLLGGVIKGQQLIEGARVRNLASQLESLRSAIHAFRDRYGALPGDMARATTLLDAGLNNGDGDGTIDTDAERAGVWQHLATAGLITGGFDGTAIGANWNSCPDTTCPRNLFGGDLLFSLGQEATGSAVDRNELRSGGRIPAAMLAEIDRRIDDGSADSGDLRAANYNAATCLSGNDWNILGGAVDCGAILFVD